MGTGQAREPHAPFRATWSSMISSIAGIIFVDVLEPGLPTTFAHDQEHKQSAVCLSREQLK